MIERLLKSSHDPSAPVEMTAREELSYSGPDRGPGIEMTEEKEDRRR
jgi:hypothetical protein